MISSLEELKQVAKQMKNELSNESAFEKLLTILIDFGMDEPIAERMIADCIDEQYRLDTIAKDLRSVYQDAKEAVINNGVEYQA